MFITNTNNIEQYPIKEYKGLVFGEVIEGLHMGKDFLAGFTNMVGGRSHAYEDGIRTARNHAIDELIINAHEMGANAIIGVSFDYEYLQGMFAVIATGTAVVI